MTITIDADTALRAILKMFGGFGPDGVVAGDVDLVQINILCPTGGGPETVVLYQRPESYGRPVVSKTAAALMPRPFGPDPNS